MSQTIHKQPMTGSAFAIDEQLVARLLSSQFPMWAGLPIVPVTPGGWDNRTFRLGADMLVRVPSAPGYASSVAKEQRWLPRLAPHLPLRVPEPLAAGKPGCGLAWNWSIYRWLPGEPASTRVSNLSEVAADLAKFLNALHQVDGTGGPLPGPGNFHRGGSLSTYDSETRQAIILLSDRFDASAATSIWELALNTAWRSPPVWVHGDVSAGNLLILEGTLSAVVDFGQLAIGDPACDLAIAWTLFNGQSRERFRRELLLDEHTWIRGRGWALWKALIVAAEMSGTDPKAARQSWNVLDQIFINQERTDA